MENSISSKRAATILSVNESTVKRWADSGYLKCYKTPGGHRKFRLKDIKDLADDYDINTEGIIPLEERKKLKVYVTEKKFEKLVELFEQHLLSADIEQAFSLFYTLFMSNFTLSEIFDKIISRAMYRIGTKWEDRTLGIEDEHIASNTLVSVLHQLEKNIIPKSFSGKIAVCSGPEEELHDIGLLCVRIALEYSGIRVVYPGSNLPLQSLRPLIEEYRPDIICISTTGIHGRKKLRITLDEIKKLPEASKAVIFAGGNGAKRAGGNSHTIYCGGIEDMLKHLAEKTE